MSAIAGGYQVHPQIGEQEKEVFEYAIKGSCRDEFRTGGSSNSDSRWHQLYLHLYRFAGGAASGDGAVRSADLHAVREQCCAQGGDQSD